MVRPDVQLFLLGGFATLYLPPSHLHSSHTITLKVSTSALLCLPCSTCTPCSAVPVLIADQEAVAGLLEWGMCTCKEARMQWCFWQVACIKNDLKVDLTRSPWGNPHM